MAATQPISYYLEMQEMKEVITPSDNSIKVWLNYYRNIGLSEILISQYRNYIVTLKENRLPPIFEINHLALLLGVKKDFLLKIINGQESFYREFTIPKRSGGERLITAPLPSLLLIQKWIYNNILKQVSIHKCAHAYTENKSIISNCKVHLNSKEYLKLDLRNFFPSIGFNRIILMFNKLGYSKRVSYYLAKLCTLDGNLPQGAPSSPSISNIITRKLDNRLFALAQQFELKYTRYADDIIFSGNKINIKLRDYVMGILSDEGFILNHSKTRFYKNDVKTIITGISLKGKEMKLPRNSRRKLVLELNYILKFGYDSHVAKKKIRSLKYLQSLIGRLNFWLQIEPNNDFAKKAKSYLINELRKKTNL